MTKNNSKWNSVVITVKIIIGIWVVLGFWFYLEGRASKELLDKLALIKPGIKLADISEQLGGWTMHESKEFDDVIWEGPIKDKEFCKGKKLYRFTNVVTPTCRGIKVYTDTNDVIVYTTWYQE
jgi:hypothetical protein